MQVGLRNKGVADLKRFVSDRISQRRPDLLEETVARERLDQPLRDTRREIKLARDLAHAQRFRPAREQIENRERPRDRLVTVGWFWVVRHVSALRQ